MASATTQRRRGRRAGADGDATFQGLCEFVQAEMERLHVPGVAVGVVHDGQDYTAGFGVTSVENPLPVTTDTLFQIGSTTKTVTGTAAMRLVEQGKLDLDAPVRTYLPKLRLKDPDAAARVTLRHLFNHTGGWLGDYFDDTGMGDDALRRIVTRMARLPQLTPLGEVWSYNNAGYYIAGRVLEVVTGKPYETVVRELVFDPLGMAMSFFFPGDVMVHRFAVGHTVQGDETKIATPWPLPRAAHAAGGVTSTVKDQLTYARFHLGDGAAPDGARLLSPESMKEMQTPRVDAGSQAGMLGVTWWVKDLDGVRVIRHGGTTNGQLSAFVLAPSRGFALTVLTNANRGGELHGNAVEWALREYLGVTDPAPQPLTLSAEQLAPYAGRYRAAMSELELTVRDGELVAQMIPKGGFPKRDSPAGPPPPPTRVGVCADDRIVALDPPYKGARGEFLRDAEGNITWLRFGGRIARRQ